MKHNKWHVYEWLRHTYMRTGHVPDWKTVKAEFPTLRFVEIHEGIKEFQLTIGKFDKEALRICGG